MKSITEPRKFKSKLMPGVIAIEGEKFYYMYYKDKVKSNRNNKIPKTFVENNENWEEITLKAFK